MLQILIQILIQYSLTIYVANLRSLPPFSSFNLNVAIVELIFSVVSWVLMKFSNDNFIETYFSSDFVSLLSLL